MAKRSRMTGARELNNTFRKITPGLAVPMNEASRKALRPMLNVAKANLRSNGNVLSGELLKLLTIKRDPRSPRMRPVHMVGPDATKGPGYRKAHLVELGTRPHMIGNKFHPGARAFPFLAPAFEATRHTVMNMLGVELGRAIERRAKRVSSRAPRR